MIGSTAIGLKCTPSGRCLAPAVGLASPGNSNPPPSCFGVGGMLRLRGGYRDIDIVRHYVLVMSTAPAGVEESDLLRDIQVSCLFYLRIHASPA